MIFRVSGLGQGFSDVGFRVCSFLFLSVCFFFFLGGRGGLGPLSLWIQDFGFIGSRHQA